MLNVLTKFTFRDNKIISIKVVEDYFTLLREAGNVSVDSNDQSSIDRYLKLLKEQGLMY